MGIGKRIKEARERLGMTQNELAEIVGVTGSAITNYEKETSHPKEPIMYKLFDALQVDANYLFQDVVNIPKKINDVTFSEYEYIKKYRNLDPLGQEHIQIVFKWETERVHALEKQKEEFERLSAFRSQSAATQNTLSNSDEQPKNIGSLFEQLSSERPLSYDDQKALDMARKIFRDEKEDFGSQTG